MRTRKGEKNMSDYCYTIRLQADEYERLIQKKFDYDRMVAQCADLTRDVLKLREALMQALLNDFRIENYELEELLNFEGSFFGFSNRELLVNCGVSIAQQKNYIRAAKEAADNKKRIEAVKSNA